MSSLGRAALVAVAARRHHAREVAHLSKAPWHSRAEMDALRLALLGDTVRRAAAHSPFYRQLLGPSPPVPRSFEELAALPVTSKLDMRDSGLDRAAARSLLGPNRVWRTSGSSGQPYEFRVDQWYPDRHLAQRAFVYRRAGVQPGERILEIVPGSARIRGPKATYPTFRRDAVGYRRDDVVAAVREVRPRLLYGNLSHLLQVADQFAAAGDGLVIPLVCSSSETLHSQDEARLKQVFGGRVLEIYGSTEASNIAYRLEDDEAWTILEPRIIVEVLDDDRRPVQPGGVGEVVVTTLTERTSPLIRYATGDLVRVSSGNPNGASGLELAALEGRSDESLLGTSGERISFWAVATAAFWVSPEVGPHVARWQLHQRGNLSVHVRLELTPRGSAAAIRDAVVAHVQSQIGPVPVTVEVVPSIQPAAGGKFRAVTSDALVPH